jgi:glycolate oxidase iron-sulfur subunit
MSGKSIKDRVTEESNQCVACGLCLPHCPTYRLLQSEADSPRGRIALMSGAANGRISMNARFVEHMERCLTCRACEAACPNKVAYGDLIDQTKAMIAQQTKSDGKKRSASLQDLLILFLHWPKRLESLRRLFSFAQRSNALRWFGKLSRLSEHRLFRFVAQLPQVKFPYVGTGDGYAHPGNSWRGVYPAQGQVRGSVGLFLGCVARITDVETLNASIYVLNRLGYTVHVPSAQTCCGAIDRHRGALMQADSLTQQNKKAFSELSLNAIISAASGCGVQLLESGVAGKQVDVMDISHFLVAADGWGDVKIAPLPQKIWVHEPCTLRNVLRSQQYPYQLLARIPGVQAMPLVGNDQCCGAAGVYFMEQPDLADQLLDEKLVQIKENEVSCLVTSNIGCAMYIAHGLHGKSLAVKVMHPVALLARQMGLEL